MRIFPSSFLMMVLATILLTGVVRAETVERIVAIVNDEIITKTDIAAFAEKLRSGGLTDDLLVPNEEVKNELLADQSKLLNKMIDEKLLDSQVKKQNLSVPIERVEQEIRTIAKRNNVSREALKSALEERGVNFSDYQNFIRTGLERQGLIEKEVTSKIKISEDDVLSALAQRRKSPLTQAYEYSISHILFLNEKGGTEAARQRAEQALKRLKSGADFEKLASEVSEDPNFEQGGLLGTFRTGELKEDLEKVVQKLAAGEHSEVLPTRDGYEIVKVNKKRLIPDPRTEGEREQLRAELYEKAFRKQFQSWLEQLRQDAFVRINEK